MAAWRDIDGSIVVKLLKILSFYLGLVNFGIFLACCLVDVVDLDVHHLNVALKADQGVIVCVCGMWLKLLKSIAFLSLIKVHHLCFLIAFRSSSLKLSSSPQTWSNFSLAIAIFRCGRGGFSLADSFIGRLYSLSTWLGM